MLAGMTWDSIISALGTGVIAEALGQWNSTVSGWRTRGIPAGHWAAVVTLAEAKGRPDVTLEILADLAARKLEEARA